MSRLICTTASVREKVRLVNLFMPLVVSAAVRPKRVILLLFVVASIVYGGFVLGPYL